jgi:hypothetical protein
MVGVAAIAGAGRSLGVATASTSGGGKVPSLRHVFVIVGENTNYDELNRDRTPYLLGTLRPQAAWLTDYRALAVGPMSLRDG